MSVNEAGQPDAGRIAEDFPGWEAWQGLVNGLWHARLVGATPPVMVHGESAEELREQIRLWRPAAGPP